MTTDETLGMPLSLELAEEQPLPTVEDWRGGSKSNSHCVNNGFLQIDDAQIDEVDLF
ncbi:MAG TPA: hypothetical protein VF040_13945 [Ktedonobacterales bacterium]